MFCNFMTMVEHGWTSVLKKQMIELELNLSKLTDFIMHAPNLISITQDECLPCEDAAAYSGAYLRSQM